MEKQEYVVTELAGPKVASRVAKTGETLQLTEEEARTELLAGAIVPKGSESDPHKGSKRLAGIQARAQGFDDVREAEAAAQEAQAPAGPSGDAGKPDPGGSQAGGGKPDTAKSDTAKSDTGKSETGSKGAKGAA